MSGIAEGAAKGAAKALIEGPIKQSVGAVFDTVNRKVEAFDLLGKYGKAQKRQIKTTHANIKLLGMTSIVDPNFWTIN